MNKVQIESINNQITYKLKANFYPMSTAPDSDPNKDSASTSDNQLKGFAIYPKMDCPHLVQDQAKLLLDFLVDKNTKHFSEFECHECKDTKENWICLNCQAICCSRYVKSHMVEHNQSSKHPVALSFSDASFWCYDCESYIDAPSLKLVRITLSKSKFSSPSDQLKDQHQEKALNNQLNNLNIDDQEDKEDKVVSPFKYEELIEGLQKKKFEKIVILSGAGLSVASGIPDFRSPNTGLYAKLQKYNLPYPESVFEISYFKKNPEPFLHVAKEFLHGQFEPTTGHKFLKKLQDEKILSYILTQNIDDLQTKCGIDENLLLQTHGHGRTAHCLSCHKENSAEEWKKHLENLEVMKCKECQTGLVKPDIVFFGEQLPKKFHQAPQIIKKADLVFIIGTSLAVMPFSFLTTMIDKDCPVVLVNNQDSLTSRKDKLWMKGDIQENFSKLAKQLKWDL